MYCASCFWVQSVVPVCFFGKWLVCCLESNIISLCGVVRFATCLTVRLDSLHFSVFFVVFIVVSVIGVEVSNRGCTVVVFRVFFVAATCLFLVIHQRALVFVISWFITAGFCFSEFFVAYWFIVFTCSSSEASEPSTCNFRFKCVTICSYVLFLSGPGLLVSSGVLEFWHIWVVGW